MCFHSWLYLCSHSKLIVHLFLLMDIKTAGGNLSLEHDLKQSGIKIFCLTARTARSTVTEINMVIKFGIIKINVLTFKVIPLCAFPICVLLFIKETNDPRH